MILDNYIYFYVNICFYRLYLERLYRCCSVLVNILLLYSIRLTIFIKFLTKVFRAKLGSVMPLPNLQWSLFLPYFVSTDQLVSGFSWISNLSVRILIHFWCSFIWHNSHYFQRFFLECLTAKRTNTCSLNLQSCNVLCIWKCYPCVANRTTRQYSKQDAY